MTVMEAWPSGRLSELADIWNEAAPHEPLVEDELEACWRAGSAVVGTPAGAMVAHTEDNTLFIDLLAVRPGARRRGLGSQLVAAAIDMFAADGVQWGASVPWYLWPGIDTSCTEALGLAESMGFENRRPAIQNMTVDPLWQVGRASTELRVVRADPAESSGVLEAVAAEYPGWVDEFRRGIEQGTVHVVCDGDGPLGAGAHSVNRLGWIGPMATFARGHGRGVGTEALAAVCADLASAGYGACEIAWVGPVRFYAKAAGATMGRTFLPMTKQIRSASTP